MVKSVCVIESLTVQGAGPSGLVAAKSLLHNAPKGTFKVTLVDSKHDIGGLWPTSRDDNERQVHPLMIANQSKHTMHFSEHAWEEGSPQLPQAWQVGCYLKRYLNRFLAGEDSLQLELETQVIRTDKTDDGWDVVLRKEGQDEEKRPFDYIVVASGFFGRPIIPQSLRSPKDVPVMHSSSYRDLKGLLGEGRPGGGKILVVGGQMSGVEIAGTIATHLSSAIHSSEDSGIKDIDKYTIHHIIQRPIWVFPLYTSPEAGKAAAPFLPLDFASYNLSNRPAQLVNTQGHISEDAAKIIHNIYQRALGTDQSPYSDHLRFGDKDRRSQPYLAVSDWYAEFVRSGLITISKGRLDTMDGTTATLSPSGEKVDDIAAVVTATGFDPSPCIDFLPESVLQALSHSPKHVDQPVALAFHGTHHPSVSNLGFVGFYRSPYWGVMQMQARFLARYWSQSEMSPIMREKLDEDVSMQRTLDLRDDPRCSQFPMGDYPFLMQEMAQALEIPQLPPLTTSLPALSHNQQPLNTLMPSRYPDPREDNSDTEASLKDAWQVALDGMTTPRFVAKAVFRSLLGTWRLERDLVSKLPTHPSGHFSGKAQFLLRRKTTDGLQCAGSETPAPVTDEGLEYLYIEEGEFKTDLGFGFTATRRYVYRYDDATDKLSVWFVKPDDLKRADYLFHEIDFEVPENRDDGWKAKSGHLCIDDFYDVEYGFKFNAVNLKEWDVGYTVKGPKKDYTIRGTYTRE
ncbi:uncharacterized protein F5Z01DRAFT_636383 [Emericellopsis atlantica]|uniref:DUF6314 domain-containing protein n=1 Tax=Emericellopsis atlantica TaxID=2614577 RepID=A0A9P7ZLT6_9HYPO|nr:uncharacterized protein F5Z01DRAFT_636383 [Emericellopsis atlantica]KAG9254306.1 hypothetical protein F5Z01DRAFT_636383 [Emericellopsis atlantica]